MSSLPLLSSYPRFLEDMRTFPSLVQLCCFSIKTRLISYEGKVPPELEELLESKKWYWWKQIHFIGGNLNGSTPLAFHACFDPIERRWLPCPSLGEARSDAMATAHGSCMYVFGGADSRQVLNTYRAFDTQTEKWSVAMPMPFPMCRSAAVSGGDAIYIVGGMNANEYAPFAYRFTPSAGEWKELPRPPWTLSEHRCVYIGKHLICLVLHDQYPCRLVFDTEKSTWEQFCSCDPSSVVEYEAPAVGMIDGVIYIAGGYALHSTTREVIRVNPETWEVNRCAPMPVGVAWAVAAVFDRKLWVIGGDIGLQTSRSNTVQIYDPATDSWRLDSAAPYRSGGAVGGTV